MKLQPDGSHSPIPSERVVEEIGAQLQNILDAYGPSSIAVYTGTQAFMNSLGRPVARALLEAIGSPCNFSTMTIDQSAKWIAEARAGTFAAGLHPFEQSDVWLAIGTNPLVSLLGGPGLSGFAGQDPVKSLKDAKAERGLKLIVIDPRFTETARFADLHLKPRPGTDALLLGAILFAIITNGWHDSKFCEAHVNGLEQLQQSLQPFTLEMAQRETDVPADKILAAARMFARDGSRGRAGTGTGTDMGPFSNLAEHFAHAINVVCGRFLRAGDSVPNPGVLNPVIPRYAEVIPPSREWESGPRGRVHGTGRIKTQMMTATMADEILSSSEDRIRALICVGGNPAVAVPDEEKVRSALGSLELLVSVDPYMSATAKLAHYVVAPKVQYERTDHTGTMEFLLGLPYARLTEAVIQPEEGMEVVDEWRFFFELARAMGLNLTIGQTVFDTSGKIDEATLIKAINPSPRISFEELRVNDGGAVYAFDQAIQPGRPENNGKRIELLPFDVAEEIEGLLAGVTNYAAEYPGKLLLTVRRDRRVVNSFLTDFSATRKLHESAPLHMHPQTMAALDLSAGSKVRVSSAKGSVIAVAEPDQDLREDTVQMSHCWPTTGQDSPNPRTTSALIDSENNLQAINRMPVMSAIPVLIEKIMQ